jgi:hypothetical protein
MTTLPASDATPFAPDPGGTRVPIDLPEATLPTSRRTFLARTVAGGALAAAATATGTALLGGPASAQDDDTDGSAPLRDDAFAELVIPLELAASLAYQAALDGGKLDEETAQTVLRFQGHHQDVVEALTSLLGDGAEAPTPDETIATEVTGPLADAADQAAVLTALSALEDALAATHLEALGTIADQVTAKTAAQVLATESQQSVVLGRKAGLDLDDLTPATVTTDAALTGAN